MTYKPRVNLLISDETDEKLTQLSQETGATRTDIMRRALTLILLLHEAKKNGEYLGFVSDRKKLDREIVGLV
jgi:hypothetical protein